MGSISHKPKSNAYLEANRASSAMGETNDCTIISIVITTNTPYEKVHNIMKRLGRKRGRGTTIANMKECCKELGYQMVPWTYEDLRDVISCYPGAHSRLQNITTHHPRRFPKVWSNISANRALIFDCRTHVAAVVNGELHDWTINRAKRVMRIWEITKA